MRRNGRSRTGAQAKRRRARIARRLAGRKPRPKVERPDWKAPEILIPVDAAGVIHGRNGDITGPLACATCELARRAVAALGGGDYAMCSACVANAYWSWQQSGDWMETRGPLRIVRRTDFSLKLGSRAEGRNGWEWREFDAMRRRPFGSGL